MVLFPQEMRDIVRAAADKHPADIDKAVDMAVAQIRKLSDLETLVRALIRMAVTEMVYDCRHRITQGIKAEARNTAGPAKVSVGKSLAVAEVCDHLYALRINGTMLGLLLGKDLQALADSERAVGEGHIWNARLLQRLVPLVPAGKRVRDAVSGRRLVMIVREINDSITQDAA